MNRSKAKKQLWVLVESRTFDSAAPFLAITQRRERERARMLITVSRVRFLATPSVFQDKAEPISKSSSC